ncbi:MAG: VIT1/CCC1 transporter family protein [Actinobacteria bacterium]|nr:VIT1/CCC1 transporter family protein [Actinomycetota bacterium]
MAARRGNRSRADLEGDGHARDVPPEAIDRLLEAWRGEIEARKIYELLTEREPDPRRAQILRQIAEAESRHRRRIEARLSELGVPIPDPGSVKLSLWRRLQARLAPTERVLAAQEAAEDTEIRDRYRRPTGDDETDALLRDIRRDETEHARGIRAMRRSEGGEAPPSEPQSALSRMLGRESWHRTGTGWISGAIYGANDGLAAVFGIVSGISGATGGSNVVLMAGLAGALASALSMGVGAFLAERSEAEVVHANLARERQEIEEHPEEEKEELSLFYQLKGLDKAEADALADKLSRNPDAELQLLGSEELGISREQAGGGDPVQAALAGGISTGLGAMIPVLPFFWLHGMIGVVVAAAVSIVAHFLVGASKSLVTLRTWWASGLEMTLVGIIVGAVTYVAGLLFPSF